MSVNNETLQDDYDYMQELLRRDYEQRKIDNLNEETKKQLTASNPDLFPEPSLGKLLEVGKQLQDYQMEFAKRFMGIEVVCNENLPDYTWRIECGVTLYKQIMEICSEPK